MTKDGKMMRRSSKLELCRVQVFGDPGGTSASLYCFPRSDEGHRQVARIGGQGCYSLTANRQAETQAALTNSPLCVCVGLSLRHAGK